MKQMITPKDMNERGEAGMEEVLAKTEDGKETNNPAEHPQPETLRIKEKIEERRAQSFSSRLCEYITGIKPEDPAIIERLRTDQEMIRAKYELPSWEMSLTEREGALMGIAQNLKVKIKSKSECGKFFEENFFAGAVHFGESNTIGTDINRSEEEKYKSSLNVLEHELIHAIQQKNSPRMPIELMEYEAYIAAANIKYLNEHPEAVDEILFNFFIGISVNTHYRLLSEKRGERVTPKWDNPEFFLGRDGISQLKPK